MNRQKIELRRAQPEDLPAIEALLRQSQLPLDGVQEHAQHFWVARDGNLAGCAGMEIYGDAALLRSVAVARERQGSGIGAQLVDKLLENARAHAVSTVYILTTTAEDYFARRGFVCIPRDAAAARLAASAEFQGACPASAICMKLDLPEPFAPVRSG